jgi:hypothetical protein
VELDRVHGAENGFRGPVAPVEHGRRALAQPRPEHRFGEIGARFRQRSDGVAPRHVAPPESGDLRKDEPHPVALLAAPPQLGERLLIDGCLGRHEAIEAEIAAHPDSPISPPKRARPAPASRAFRRAGEIELLA